MSLWPLARPALLFLAACSSKGAPSPAATAAARDTDASSSPTAAPPAGAGDVAMTLAVEGSKLLVTLTSRSDRPLSIARHVESDTGRHVDWLAVQLEGPGGERALRFVDDRNESGRVVETLAPGASLTESVDLASWAVRAMNGDPLQPRAYAVRATWDARRETAAAAFIAAAATSLTIAAPRAPCTAAEAKLGARIELLARQLPGPGVKLQVGLHNRSSDPLCVVTHVATHELQSDWLSVHLSYDGERVIRFVDSRDRSAPMSAFLPPGATAWQTWDLAAWAARPANGGRPLPAGKVLGASVSFRTTAPDAGAWAWNAESWVRLTVP